MPRIVVISPIIYTMNYHWANDTITVTTAIEILVSKSPLHEYSDKIFTYFLQYEIADTTSSDVAANMIILVYGLYFCLETWLNYIVTV